MFFDPRDAHRRNDPTLGTKTIGFVLSVIFIVNQIYGPGVLAIPIIFQESGLVLTLLSLTLFLVVSCFASTCLCEAMSLIPGNKNFEQRIEYSSIVRYYCGPRTELFFQVFLNITLQAYSIASIVVCAQMADQFLIWVAGHTVALELYPHPGFHLFEDIDYLYSSAVVTISVGYLITMLICLPMSMLNLDDNTAFVQTASFVFLVLLLGEFCVAFFITGLRESFTPVPMFGSVYSQLVSVFIFSWAFVMFIPSWVNEAVPGLSVNKAVWVSGFVSWLGYLGIGLLCAMTHPHLIRDNMLVRLSLPPSSTITRVCAYLFSPGVILPGIPVCCITIRYNLYVSGLCGKKQSYFWAVWAPWLVGFIFCQGQFFADLLNWTSLLFNSVVNFILPFFLYFLALRKLRIHKPSNTDSLISSFVDDVEGHGPMISKSLVSSLRGAVPVGVATTATGSSSAAGRVSDSSSLTAASGGVAVAEGRDGEEVDDEEGEDPCAGVEPIPHWLSRLFGGSLAAVTLTLLVVTVVVSVAQIVVDLYYLLVLHENLLGG
eukprot:gnl/Spiro4/10027_TR5317_c0_g1_i1.p1 gnl/Spiro4/10027_TR5317_c0_g1~~gnl/Spiro4/10027_TR5317_c0_g1_i1.p1  ORF type:complete len:600 (+),score=99.18 gnl/Spiro4/10027_TR5317_c0_g1_i1:171-1802(+)